MGSSRLPGKVLMDIGGEPSLALLIRRCLKARKIDTVVVVTSEQPEDNAIEALAKRLGVACFRGSLNDVLKRFIDAAEAYGIDQIIRICGDGPFRVPELIDESYDQHRSEGNEYTDAHNCDIFISSGLGAELVTLEALKKCAENPLQEDREHVTYFIRKHKNDFKCGLFRSNQKYWVEGLNLLLDTPADYEKMKSFIQRLPKDRNLADIAVDDMRVALSTMR